MTTQLVLRQKVSSVALTIACVIAFVALLTVSGTTGHLLSLFGISYSQALQVVLAIINHAISTLPASLQGIAKAVEQAVLALYNHSGLPTAIAW